MVYDGRDPEVAMSGRKVGHRAPGLGVLLLLLPAIVSPAGLAGPPPSAPSALDDATFATWRDAILPAPDEIAWKRIPWRSSLRSALQEEEAGGSVRPILLWLMNGHPLGCT
jgi:hypothetical protein